MGNDWIPTTSTIPWEREELHTFVYCLICHHYFPLDHPGWRQWMCHHAHLWSPEMRGAGRGDSYLPVEDPEYSRQMWLKIGGHFRSSDEMLEGFSCDVTDMELLSLQLAKEDAA